MSNLSPSIAGFGFGHPWWLLLLLGLAPLLRRLTKHGPQPAVTFSSLKLLADLERKNRPRVGSWRLLLRTIIVVLVVVALARPRISKSADEQQSEGIDIMLVVDCSESMDSRDFDMGKGKGSRMEALQRVMGNFIKARDRDRIGVIGFSEKPFLISPLTLDHSWMMEALLGVKTSLGTAIGGALEAGVDLLSKSSQGTKVVILLTDGLNTSGPDPLEAAALARRFGVRLYTIGVVAYEQMQTQKLDKVTLYQMARMTGGSFFQAGNGEALQGIYNQIDQLERTKLRQARSTDYRELFGWVAALAAVLLTVDLLLNYTRAMRLP